MTGGPGPLEREGSQAEPQGEDEETADGQDERQGGGPHDMPYQLRNRKRNGEAVESD